MLHVTIEDFPESATMVDGFLQFLIYCLPYFPFVGGKLLFVVSLVSDHVQGEFLERASVEVNFLHPVVHAFSEGGGMFQFECIADKHGIA